MSTISIPTAALNALRRSREEADRRVIPGVRTSEVDAFLTAVDEANANASEVTS